MRPLETIIAENNPKGDYERDYQALTLDNLNRAEQNVSTAENYANTSWKRPISLIREMISSAISFIRGETW